MADVSEMILKLLKSSKKPLSTYQIAKKLNISWSTANTHCYKLKDEGKIEGKMESAKIGSTKKMLWWHL